MRLLTILLTAALAACQPGSDQDGDGHHYPLDCDDENAAIHPDATESCNGVDDNCDGQVDEAGAVGEQAWYEDADDDGFGNGADSVIACDAPAGWVATTPTDCDDYEPLTWPGADELCDRMDNDCDGQIDEDAIDALTWYLDADGDGYGQDDAALTACEAPTGYAESSGDCDDDDADVHPSADERCNGQDDDCDGLVDEQPIDGLEVYPDADEDGYGDEAAGTTACEVPDGFTATGGDCDDQEPAINPGMQEVCGNGLDDDCDGAPGACGGPDGYLYFSDAHASILGEAVEDQLWQGVGVGDVDGDGYDDLWLGASQHDSDGIKSTGSVYLVLGPISGEIPAGSADAIRDGDVYSLLLGNALARAGDIDGDGLADLAAGAIGEAAFGSQTGAVFLWYGPISGRAPASDADAQLIGEAEWDTVGYTLAGGEDVDGDGQDDLLISAYGHDRGAEDAGAVYLVTGLPLGESSLATADATLLGTVEGGYAGRAVALPGDLDGDGYAEVLVGDKNQDTAWLWFGPLAGERVLQDADVCLWSAEDSAGEAVSGARDVNADGYLDLLVGAPSADGVNSDMGAVFLVLGPCASDQPLAGAQAVFEGYGSGFKAGAYVAGPGDVNADGFADLWIGAPADSSGGLAAGAAYLVHGPVSGTYDLSRADARIIGAAYSYSGNVATAGDLDGDGAPDLLVGALMTGLPEASAGAVYMFQGGLGQ